MILSVCSNISVLSTIRIVRIVVTILKILVPILLIISSMVSYLKTISSGEIDKTNKKFVNQIIAAISVFLIPTLITVILNLVWPNSEINQCWINASGEKISQLKVDNTDILIKKMEANFNLSTYQSALNSAKSIDDKSLREEKVKQVKSYEKYTDILDEINTLSQKFNRNTFNELYSEIENIEIESIRETFLDKIENIGGKPLNIDTGIYTFSLSDLSYNVYIPNSVTQNMPLIMYLHGDGGGENTFYKYVNKVYGDDYPFIIVAPIGGSNPLWNEKSGRKEVLKSIVDSVCNEYLCDTSRISISGHSRGAIGTWGMVNTYPNYFYSAVPVSCNGSIDAKNFLNTKVMAFCGNQGDDIDYYYGGMKRNVDAINIVGGNAKFVELNAGHGGTPSLALTKSTFEWMIN